MNLAFFAGRLGRDAQTRQVGETTATSFSLATDAYVNGEKRTEWVDCTIWGERGERLEAILVKGKQVSVAGRIGVRTYESNGETKAVLTLRVSEITLQGGGQDSAGDAGARRQPAAAPRQQAAAAPRQEPRTSTTSSTSAPAADTFDDDDIPF